MNLRRMSLFALCLALCLILGCARLLPSSKDTARSPWQSFEEARSSFDMVVPGQTTVPQLKTIGFDLYSTPNLRILNYLDIAIATQSLKRDEVDGGFRECFQAKNRCRAYEFEPQFTHSERYGNFWLDLFNFRRRTKETGWRFRAMFVVVDNIVVDKLWGGSPNIQQDRDLRNPLGPFQEAGSLLQRLVP
jgi:hypothetical protein